MGDPRCRRHFGRWLSGVVVVPLIVAFAGVAPAQAPHGWIQGDAWLFLGPLLNPGGCDPGAAKFGNWIAPLDMATITPAAGDGAAIDFETAASTGWGGVGDGPSWASVADSGLGAEDIVDLLAVAGSLGTAAGVTVTTENVLGVLVTYATHAGASPLPIDICSTSNDSVQIWVGDQRVQDISACRGVEAFCAEKARAVLLPGKNVIKVLVWQGGTGWGFRLRLERLDGTVITDEDPEVTFGTDRGGALGPVGGTVVRSTPNSLPECSRNGDSVVTLRGSGGLPATLRLTETVDGPVNVVGVSDGGTFTPRPPATKSPVGLFEDARDVGAFCFEGSTVENLDGSYTLTGGGTDIWIGGDEFHFAYREATGDFDMVAHVVDRVWAPASRWGKVGIMARQDLDPRARYAMLQTHGEDLQDADRFAGRATQGGADNFEATPLAVGEHREWMRLERVGNVFNGYMSLDGVDWQLFNSMNWGAEAPATVLLGLAVNGHSYADGGCTPAEITFDSVEITGGDDPKPPAGPSGGTIVWNVTRAVVEDGVSYGVRGKGTARLRGDAGGNAILGDELVRVVPDGGDLGIFDRAHDIGSPLPCVPGTSVHDPDDGSYAITGSGIDIWTVGDQFQFAYREIAGDFSLVAHVRDRAWAAGSRWGKVGIMARQDCGSRSRYAQVQTHGEDPQDADRFAARPTHGGEDNFEATTLLGGEHRDWMRLDRSGNQFLGYMSADGVDWQLLGSVSWGDAAPQTVLLGLAVNAHSDGQGGCIPATIVFDEVQLTIPQYIVSRSFPAGDCPTLSDAQAVLLRGEGDPGGAVSIREEVRGEVNVSGITGGGTFTPFPEPGPATPVGIFGDAMDIGDPCTPGSTVANPDGSYTVTGGGKDIWQPGDQFQFAYRKVGGDFDMVARVSDRQWAAGSRWGKVGIMARENHSPRARYAMLQTHGEDLQDGDRFAGRRTQEGDDNFEATPLLGFEHRDWMRLERVGSVFNGYMSLDGADWQLFYSMDWGPDAPGTVLLGLAVCSHSDIDAGCSTAAITFDDVEILGGNGPLEPLRPLGGAVTWTGVTRTVLSGSGVGYTIDGRGLVRIAGTALDRVTAGPDSAVLTPVATGGLGVLETAHDIGIPCDAGSTAYDPGDESYTLTTAGRDIWQGGDQFHFAYKAVAGDFSMVAHAREKVWAPGSRWGKVGIMARQDCSTRARYAMIQIHGEDLQDQDRFAARPTHGGADNFEATPLAGFEHRDWLRLDRVGNIFTGYLSDDGVSWQATGTVDWGPAAPPEVLLGLAGSVNPQAPVDCAATTIVFDAVEITVPGGEIVFRRGDPNDDGSTNITDGIYILNYLFLGGPTPTCLEAADANDDGGVNITDGIFVLNFLFLGGPTPPAPGPPPGPCGPDRPGSVDLGCASYTRC